MWDAILKPVFDWFRSQSANNQLTAALVLMIATMLYFQYDDAIARRSSTEKAHTMVHEVLDARDKRSKEDQERTDKQNERLISVLMNVQKGVEKSTVEQKKTTEAVKAIPEAAAAAAKTLEER